MAGSLLSDRRLLKASEMAVRVTVLLVALSVFPDVARAAQAQAQSPQPPAPAVEADPEAEQPAAPVLVGGEPIIWITAGAGPYTPAYRADQISRRVGNAVHDRSIQLPTVKVSELGASSELRVGTRLLMVVTERDAASLGVSRAALAQQFASALEAAIRAERVRYAPGTLLRSGLFGLIATFVFVAIVWLIQRLTVSSRAAIERRLSARVDSLGVMQEEIISSGRLSRTVHVLIRAIRIGLILLAFDLYLTFVLGLFPWTRAVSHKLLAYLLTPIAAVGAAVVGYLPKFLFLLVIAAVFYAAIKLVGLFFGQIKRGRLVFASFPAEWADPTNKIARVLLIAFGLVVAFPYLPASDSPAFAGVSVFLGVLFSLASSSAFSNMIAGIVLTYTGAFRLGDRVKVGDGFGDIIETSLLATRVRTIKNEDITIPNSIALGTAITNYSREATGLGLILHTTVTIGYDAPWRKVHDLLINAALATPGILAEPRPFVWQTALNDFYVTYEINAYTRTPKDMIDIYAALHSRIQDEFYAAGVEIMSPHYTSIRDGNTVAIPEQFRESTYASPAFRVTKVKRGDTIAR